MQQRAINHLENPNSQLSFLQTDSKSKTEKPACLSAWRAAPRRAAWAAQAERTQTVQHLGLGQQSWLPAMACSAEELCHEAWARTLSFM